MIDKENVKEAILKEWNRGKNTWGKGRSLRNICKDLDIKIKDKEVKNNILPPTIEESLKEEANKLKILEKDLTDKIIQYEEITGRHVLNIDVYRLRGYIKEEFESIFKRIEIRTGL